MSLKILALPVVALSIIFSGCATPKVLTKNTVPNAATKTLYAVHHAPVLDFLSAIDAAGLGYAQGTGNVEGQIDAQMAITASDVSLLQVFNIEDPAIYIKNKLAEELGHHYSFGNTVIHTNALPRHENKFEEIQNYFPHDGYLLTVTTFYWVVSYFVFDWNNYAMRYCVKVKIYNTETGELIFSDKISATDKETAPTHVQLFASKATVFRTMKQKLAEDCLIELRQELGLPAIQLMAKPTW